MSHQYYFKKPPLNLSCYLVPGTVLSACIGLLVTIITTSLLSNYYNHFTGEKLKA